MGVLGEVLKLFDVPDVNLPCLYDAFHQIKSLDDSVNIHHVQPVEEIGPGEVCCHRSVLQDVRDVVDEVLRGDVLPGPGTVRRLEEQSHLDAIGVFFRVRNGPEGFRLGREVLAGRQSIDAGDQLARVDVRVDVRIVAMVTDPCEAAIE